MKTVLLSRIECHDIEMALRSEIAYFEKGMQLMTDGKSKNDVLAKLKRLNSLLMLIDHK